MTTPAQRGLMIVLLCIWSMDGFCQLNENLYALISNVHGRKVTSLDGKWQVIIDPFESGYYNHRYQPRQDGFFRDQKAKDKSDRVEYNFETSEQLSVPGDWNTQMEKLSYYEGTIWYRKSFVVDKTSARRLFLHFGAVNYEAQVYLNGKKIGKHTGGFTPFNFDITDDIVDGVNVVILKVDNQRRREAVPTLNTDWWNYGGITRSVSLVEVPNSFVLQYGWSLASGSVSDIEGWVWMDRPTNGQQVEVEIPALKIRKSAPVGSDGKARFKFKAEPELWSPERPALYDVTMTSGEDVVTEKIGFRSISVSGEDILLNGKSTFLKGVCIHEEAPFRGGRAYSEEDARILLGWAKELGCNFVRLAHYTHNENMVREADRLGLLVWSEVPVYWTILWENAETLENAKHQLKESITRDRNRASIVLWSVANETPVSDARNSFLKALVDVTRAHDPTRLVTAASDTHSTTGEAGNTMVISDPVAEHLDVVGVNYYCGWYAGAPESCGAVKWKSVYKKPVIMSEFGAGALQGFHADSLTRWSEEYQSSVYRNNFKMIQSMDFIRGTTPWLLMDFKSPKRPLPNIQDGYNRKGIISERGIRKSSFYLIRDFYSGF